MLKYLFWLFFFFKINNYKPSFLKESSSGFLRTRPWFFHGWTRQDWILIQVSGNVNWIRGKHFLKSQQIIGELPLHTYKFTLETVTCESPQKSRAFPISTNLQLAHLFFINPFLSFNVNNFIFFSLSVISTRSCASVEGHLLHYVNQPMWNYL